MRRHFRVPEELRGSRLDAVLAALEPRLSRRRAKDLIERGAVYLDGRRCRLCSRLVEAGASVEVEASGGRPLLDSVPAEILWRGEGILALAKPAGVPTVPTRESVAGTLLHAAARRLGRPLKDLHPLHRLDAATSGVFLVALEAPAAALLGEAFAQGRVEKVYLAVAAGLPSPPEGVWEWPLSEPREGRVAVDPGGRPARTRYRVLEDRSGTSLLELRPETGRTHQIRVHAAAAGHPLLGDRKYGGPWGGRAPRLLLHAFRVAFPLPSGAVQVVEAPLPEEFGTLPPPSSP